MAIDQDGYDNILDPNTMESLPKLSGFGSGNLSGSNLYIPVYNAITQEYQKVTVSDVQPDYTGVKNSLLADAITAQATPQIAPNMICSPCGVFYFRNTAGIWNTSTDNTWIHRENYFAGSFVHWKCLESSGGSATIDNTVISDTSGTLTSGVGHAQVMLPKAAASGRQTGYAIYSDYRSILGARGQPISLSFTAKCSAASKRLFYAIEYVSGVAFAVHNTTDPVTTYNSGADPTIGANWTRLASGNFTSTSTDTWRRFTLENYTLPTGATNVRVIILDTTNTAAATSYWSISGVYLHVGTKALVYKDDYAGDFARATSFVGKWTAGLGATNTTTTVRINPNFRLLIPYPPDNAAGWDANISTGTTFQCVEYATGAALASCTFGSLVGNHYDEGPFYLQFTVTATTRNWNVQVRQNSTKGCVYIDGIDKW